MVGLAGRGSKQRFVVRRLRDLAVVRERPAPRMEVGAVSCRSADGRRLAAILHVFDEPTVVRGRLVLLGGGRQRILRRARIASGTFIGDTAYLDEGKWGRDLVSVDLRTGAARSIARVPYIPGAWSLSPDRRYLATTAFGRELTDFHVSVVVDLRTGRVHKRLTGGTVLWTARNRLLNDAGHMRLFDARLRVVRRGGSGIAAESGIVRTRGRFYGLFYGNLYAVDPHRARARRMTILPSTTLRRLIAIPGGTELDVRGGTRSVRAVRRMAVRCGRLLL
ncbi:MAG: hypothetical protein M3389_06585 [Actinomycetota bacterium]|nr:hypothetical protein [Actinomycetota bacterium]